MAILKTIFTEYFDAFTKKHWDKIQAALSLSDLQIKALQAEIRKLNPKPGASMGETMGRNVQQITPTSSSIPTTTATSASP